MQGNKIVYQLKQSPHIRGIRLEIRQDSGLTVIVPREYNHQSVEELIQNKSVWIVRHLTAEHPQQLPLFNKEVDDGDRLPFMGKTIEIVRRPGGNHKPGAELIGNHLYVYINGSSPDLPKLLEAWYRMQASIVFGAKALVFSRKMGVTYKRILIRGQKTRWGSCSPLGNLTLNWKLLLAPEPVINYVIIHELAHRKHMNHSKRFWEVVAQFIPRWKEHRKWLLTHEAELKASASFVSSPIND